MERILVLTLDDQGQVLEEAQFVFELWRACHRLNFELQNAEFLEPYEKVCVEPEQVRLRVEAKP